MACITKFDSEKEVVGRVNDTRWVLFNININAMRNNNINHIINIIMCNMVLTWDSKPIC